MGTHIKVSGLMLVAAFAVMWRVQVFTTSLLITAILFLSVILHEIAHVWFSWRRGFPCPERILWPFGGLFGSDLGRQDSFVNFAGPAVNLILALAAASQLEIRAEILPLLNPTTCWQAVPSDNILTVLLRITFLVNTVIVAANLIPARPMAAGYFVQSVLGRRFSEVESRDMLLRSGLALTIIGLLAGFVFDLSGLAALSAFLLLLHVHEAVQWYQSPASSGGFGGSNSSRRIGEADDVEADSGEFDFDDEEDVPGSMMDRRKNRKESERVLRERDLVQQEHEELDRVLAKLHTEGRDSLTIAEVRLLNRVSARLRQKNHQ